MTKNKVEFRSAFAPFMYQLIQLKSKAGQECLWYIKCFKELDRLALESALCEPIFTPELVADWKSKFINNTSSTIYGKLTVWAILARYINRNGYRTYVPSLPKKEPKTFVPYIFTQEEMARIFSICDNWQLKINHIHSIQFIMPSLIRLLYATGLRISEALSLRNQDINKEDRYVHVCKTKNGTDRIVPISESMIYVLSEYEEYRNKLPLKNVDAPESRFFIKPDGELVSSASVYKRFREILEKCKIPRRGKGCGPRVHDLRHTFAVHSMVQLCREGKDLYTAMPVLSAYLGHKCLLSTEMYVRLTTAMYPELERQVSPINAFVYPKIVRHE